MLENAEKKKSRIMDIYHNRRFYHHVAGVLDCQIFLYQTD